MEGTPRWRYRATCQKKKKPWFPGKSKNNEIHINTRAWDNDNGQLHLNWDAGIQVNVLTWSESGWYTCTATLFILYHCTPLCETFVHQAFPFLFHHHQHRVILTTWLPLPLLRLPMQTRWVLFACPFIDIILTTTILQTTLNGYVGFDTITQQIEKKLLKRGFQFNVMVVGNVNCFSLSCHVLLTPLFSLSLFGHPGQTGLGKSTLVNTIFASHLIDSKGRLEAAEPPRQTTEIEQVSHCKYWFSTMSLNYSTHHLLCSCYSYPYASDWRTWCAFETQYCWYSRLWWSSQ